MRPPKPSARSNLKRKAARIARALAGAYGEPGWKGPRDALDCLVETIISQNTTDRARDAAFTRLRVDLPTWEQVAKAPAPRIEKAIRIAGLARAKTATIKRALAFAQERFGGYTLRGIEKLSDDEIINMLTAIKGIGIKTAAIVLSFALGRDVFPVDTHVARLCTRLGLAPPGSAPGRVFREMKEFCPRGKAMAFHKNLIRHGRGVCRARRPRCAECFLRRGCAFARENAQGKAAKNIGSS